MTTHTCWPYRKYTKAQMNATTYLSWCLTVTELHWGANQQVGSTKVQYGRKKQAYNFHKISEMLMVAKCPILECVG